VLTRPDPHSGLGSGTQLALAVAESLCRFVDHPCDQVDLARRIARRGDRSAVGIHGYFAGGLIYEAGQPGCPLNPVRRRVEVPGQWRVALYRPSEPFAAISGEREREQFSRLTDTRCDFRDELQSIAESEIVPAARAGDFKRFAEAVSTYNHRSGLLFASVQGGAYNGKTVADLVHSLADLGAVGVGQSSWGPSVFAWFASPEQADEFIRRLPPRFPRPLVARPLNQGRAIRVGD
jgi:beta-RFAP synthase